MFEHKLVELPLKELSQASWNYKTNNKNMMAKLKANMKDRGQVQLLIVRELGVGKYEIVNGNHRFDALIDLGYTHATCLNLGPVSITQAKRIAYETNETEFAADNIKLADIIKELTEAFSMEDLEATLPFSKNEIDDMAKLTSFDFNDEDTFMHDLGGENGDEEFDFDEAESQSQSAPERDNDHFVAEYLMTLEVREEFLAAFAMLKDKLAPKSAPKVINDDSYVGYLISMINSHVQKRNEAGKSKAP
jgi:hypothetical protein